MRTGFGVERSIGPLMGAQSLTRFGFRLGGRLGLPLGAVLVVRAVLSIPRPIRVASGATVVAAAAAALTAGAREVAKKLAGDGRGLAGHSHPRAAENLLGLRRVRHRGRQQRDGEAAVLLAGGVDDASGVAAVGAARRVHEQTEQPLRLGPALDRVFLVKVPCDRG